MSCITAKPARAVNALRPEIVAGTETQSYRVNVNGDGAGTGERDALICRGRRRLPARRVVVRPDVRRADAEVRRRCAAARSAGVHCELLPPPPPPPLSDQPP